MQISAANLLAASQQAPRTAPRPAAAKSPFELPDLKQPASAAQPAAMAAAQPSAPAGPMALGSLINILI
jgi:hypothetical protein